MDIKQLKCFNTIAQEGSFTKAAKLLNMTQPSLSYQISCLEEELGEPVLKRSSRGAILTEAGQTLRKRAIVILSETEKIHLDFELRGAMLGGSVVFGIIPTIAPFLLTKTLTGFNREHPHVQIRAREARTSQLIQEVVSGEIEFAILSDIDKATLKKHSLHLELLFEERLLLALPANHPLTVHDTLSPKMIAPHKMLLLNEGNCLRDQSISVCGKRTQESPFICEQLPTLEAIISSGLGLGIVPEMSRRSTPVLGMVYRRFNPPEPKRIIALLKRRGKKVSPAAEALIEILKTQAHS